MKPFSLILAMIVLVQSCLPCTDVFAMSTDTGTATITSSHRCQDPQSDLCSPFCQCGCCTGFAFIFHPSPVLATLPEVSLQHTEFYLSSIRNVSLPIWQPPQLAA